MLTLLFWVAINAAYIFLLYALPVAHCFTVALRHARDDAHRVLPEPPMAQFRARLWRSLRLVALAVWPVAVFVPVFWILLSIDLAKADATELFRSFASSFTQVAAIFIALAAAWLLAPRIASMWKLAVAVWLPAFLVPVALSLIGEFLGNIRAVHHSEFGVTLRVFPIVPLAVLGFSFLIWFLSRRRAFALGDRWLRLPE